MNIFPRKPSFDFLFKSFELYEIDIITNPINVTSNDNITVEKVIEIIKSIEFNKIENDKITKIKINDEWLNCEVLILAIGHSARDTFEMLYKNKLNMSSKPFAIGIRIMHPQDMINKSQYGNNKLLPPASYKLTHKSKNGRGVYSFCMCPGGFVVNASSEENMLAINGMSNHKRDEECANSAIIVTVSSKDFGDHPLSGIEFQRNLESITYKIGDGSIPVQLYKDFKDNKISSNFGKFNPVINGSYKSHLTGLLNNST